MTTNSFEFIPDGLCFAANTPHPHNFKGLEVMRITDFPDGYRIYARSIEKALNKTNYKFKEFIQSKIGKQILANHTITAVPWKRIQNLPPHERGYYILENYVPDFIAWLTKDDNDNYIKIMNEIVDNLYNNPTDKSYKYTYQYKTIRHALLVYKESNKFGEDILNFNIRELYTYGNDPKTRKIIANNDFILLEVGSKETLNKLKNDIVTVLQENFISFKPAAYSKGFSFKIHSGEGKYEQMIMNFKSNPFEKCGTGYFGA
jgi:hypothetical protein